VTDFQIGSLVRARGREWVTLPGSDATMLVLRPLGGTDDETAGVLRGLERVDPATFPPPTTDDLGDARSARMLRSALRLGFRSTAGPFRSLGGLAVTPRPYQLLPLLMALRMDTVRLLIADDVGIGKTIEAGLIASELLAQGDVRRLAVLCSPQLAPQWQQELREKFHIDAELVLASTVNRLERRLPFGDSLFEHYPFVIVSTDFIKSPRRRHDFLRACPELVLVDEAHTCVVDDPAHGSAHQRYALLRDLAADRSRHLILTTATPHCGKEGAFRRLLGLLDPALDLLPDDLTGEGNRRHRERLARHFVQRTRADIRDFLGTDTSFPDRHSTEEHYSLTPDYHRLFEDVLAYARETVTDEALGETRRRVRWWSALALLRSLASSPRAAAETLRNRAPGADADSPDEADELGRRSVLDVAEEDVAEPTDAVAGADETPLDGGEAATRRRLLRLAERADGLAGRGDAKLTKAIAMVRRLLADGFSPIVFCRFIPTADYVAEELRRQLGAKVVVESVTGALPPDERKARIDALGQTTGGRVLVASDCLSEGVNLQEDFTAVLHYDLAWNPARHEQREGRVDRFGQLAPIVRAVTYYGIDNGIDGIVLDVLLRKHEQIRRTLGVSVPVPVDSNDVMEAVLEGALLRGRDPQMLTLDLGPVTSEEKMFAEWESAAEREKRSRAIFSQHRIPVAEVDREVREVRRAQGGDDEVVGFVRDALTALRAPVRADRDGYTADLGGLPPGLREALPVRGPALRLVTQPPAPKGAAALVRTDPVVEALARSVLDAALDPVLPSRLRPARRAGVMRTAAVRARTTLLLCRFRFHLVLPGAEQERPMVAEEARVLAWRGRPGAIDWLRDEDAEALLGATPSDNVAPEQAAQFLTRALDTLPAVTPVIETTADRLAAELLDSHRRVRRAAAAQRRGLRVTAQKPVDVLGLYVYLPAPEAL